MAEIATQIREEGTRSETEIREILEKEGCVFHQKEPVKIPQLSDRKLKETFREYSEMLDLSLFRNFEGIYKDRL